MRTEMFSRGAEGLSMRAEELRTHAEEFSTRVGEPNSKIVLLIFDAGLLNSPPERQKSAILRQNRRVKGWRAGQNTNAEGSCLWRQGGRRGVGAARRTPSGSKTRHLPR